MTKIAMTVHTHLVPDPDVEGQWVATTEVGHLAESVAGSPEEALRAHVSNLKAHAGRLMAEANAILDKKVPQVP